MGLAAYLKETFSKPLKKLSFELISMSYVQKFLKTEKNRFPQGKAYIGIIVLAWHNLKTSVWMYVCIHIHTHGNDIYVYVYTEVCTCTHVCVEYILDFTVFFFSTLVSVTKVALG